MKCGHIYHVWIEVLKMENNNYYINIIEDFINYNNEKYLSGIEIESISQLLKAYRKQQEQIKNLKAENDFLKFMYSNTEEYKAIKNYSKDKEVK